jgi:hypothetical protein
VAYAPGTVQPDHLLIFSEPYPCADCPLARRCAHEQLVCQAFVRYANGKTGWRAATREPTAERFRAFFAAA